jgi:hypothetical protein
MKKRFSTGVLLLALLASSALAACPGKKTTDGCSRCASELWLTKYSWVKETYYNLNRNTGKCVPSSFKDSESCGTC